FTTLNVDFCCNSTLMFPPQCVISPSTGRPHLQSPSTAEPVKPSSTKLKAIFKARSIEVLRCCGQKYHPNGSAGARPTPGLSANRQLEFPPFRFGRHR